MTETLRKKEWTNSTTIDLVGLYEKYGAPLWNTHNPEEVYEKLAVEMEKPIDNIKKKIKDIEKKYEKEKAIFEANPNHVTTWDLYKKLDGFLNPHVQNWSRDRKFGLRNVPSIRKKLISLKRLNDQSKESIKKIETLDKKVETIQKTLTEEIRVVKEIYKSTIKKQEEMHKILESMESESSSDPIKEETTYNEEEAEADHPRTFLKYRWGLLTLDKLKYQLIV